VDLRLLLDADALIKLNRAGVLAIVLAATRCVVPQQVFQEAVINAKAKGHSDAELIEEALRGRCEVMDVVITERLSLGRGETALLALAATRVSGLVVSDDERFQAVLQSRQIPFVNCARLVAQLAEERLLSRAAASGALQALRPYISAGSFAFADRLVASMSGDRHEEN
jgi:hypothetical protein